MKLALFDFDGTITTGDSYTELLKFFCGSVRFFLGVIILSPVLILYQLGLLPNYRAKPVVTRFFLRGIRRDEFEKKARRFCEERLEKMVRPAALEKIKWHQQQGHRVVVVSASFEDYLCLWCQSKGLELIATRLEWQNDRITGKFATPNCYGPEKVRRIRQMIDFAAYEEIYAYGDSRGDREMLEIAHHKGYRVF
ncbi:MAG: HAD family hydrolase [Candidatus Rifleibacteriota bacterium]